MCMKLLRIKSSILELTMCTFATVNDILEGRIEDVPHGGELENNFNVFKSEVFPLNEALSCKTYAVSNDDESDIEDDKSESINEDHSAILYSKNIRDESSEVDKGVAVKNQLSLWEILLEYRIMLQKCLVASNKLPKPDNYESILSRFSSKDKNSIINCREKVWDSLEKLIQLQNNLRKRCPEYMETINKKSEEREDDVDNGHLKIKRRKLTEYTNILEKQYNEYIPYQNSVIQKWNDRTKIASGKFAKSNFSAFDQPILKQIEQILIDKHKLIQRTCIKRSQYEIIGESNTDFNNKDKLDRKDANLEIDAEIFDDDDFYHKLLRDYIERKTADVSDPTLLGRKWIKLQNLRNKMKRKIDTRRTKGRKIKFDVHTKLVNFMAPVVVDRWPDTAINELYNSVLGKNDYIQSKAKQKRSGPQCKTKQN